MYINTQASVQQENHSDAYEPYFLQMMTETFDLTLDGPADVKPATTI